jgi:acyl-CoA thioesterase-1
MIIRYGRRAALQKTLVLAAAPALAQGPGPMKLLCLGDSLTAGYGLPRGQGFVPQLEAALRAKGRQVRVLDGGVSGDTMAGGASRLEWLLAEKPNAAIVALGANDGLRGSPPRQMAEALDRILDRLARDRLPTLIAGMFAPPNLGQEYGRAFHAVFTEAARRRGLPLYDFFLDGVAGNASLNLPDGIHPNPHGVAIMVRRILPAAEDLLDRAAAAPAG